MNSRPTGVLVIAVYYLLSGAGALAVAIWLLMTSADTSRIPLIGADMAKYILLFAVVTAAIGAGYVATAWGLWQLRQWAQAAGIAVASLAVLLDIAVVVLLSFGGNLVPIQLYVIVGLYAAVSLGTIAYLLTPGVASVFGAPPTMPNDSTCPHCFAPGIRQGMTVCPFCRRSLFAQVVQPLPPVEEKPRVDVSLPPTQLGTVKTVALGWLVVKVGAEAGRRLDLVDDNAIGRDGKCQITLSDGFVSRNHARVKFEAGQFFIYDVGSSTGTFVNGRQVQRLMLYDGAEIRLGNTTMEFKKTAPTR